MLLASILMVSSLSRAAEITRAQQLMGTLCEITAHGDKKESVNNAISKAFAEISRLEKLMSTYIETSEISQINSRNEKTTFSVSVDLLRLVKRSNQLSAETNGAFDITLSPNGYKFILTDDETQTIQIKNAALKLDLGGIAKGYALDQAAEILKIEGINSARINFSGNILVFGPQEWTIELPDGKNTKIKNESISTSSQNNQPGHIIDPKTGKPAPGSNFVSVIAKTGTDADALSTAYFVMGKKGLHRVSAN